jgi:hypothetical protein
MVAGVWDALLPATGARPARTRGRIECATALDEWEAEGGAAASAEPLSQPGAAQRPPLERLLLERLGAALLDQWSDLPVPLQRMIYEHAVSDGASPNRTALRREMARFLHEHHHGTRRSPVRATTLLEGGPGIAL